MRVVGEGENRACTGGRERPVCGTATITIASPLSRTGKKGVGFAANVALLYCGCAIGGKAMPEQNLSAFAAMRALRDELRARLDQNEDYRAWKALDEALRQIEPRTLPQVVDFALSQMRAAPGSARMTTPSNRSRTKWDIMLRRTEYPIP